MGMVMRRRSWRGLLSLAPLLVCALWRVVAGGEAGAARPQAFRFVQLTDSHCVHASRNRPGRFLFDPSFKNLVASFELLEAAVRDINEQIRPDFVVATGDLVDRRDDLRSLRRVQAILAGLRCPCHVVIGNHDGRTAWKRVFGADRLNYTFTHGGWRFIAVDTSRRYVDERTLAWLRAQLDAGGRTPTAVLTHIPVVLAAPHVAAAKAVYGARLDLRNPGQVRGVLERHGNVRAVFAGHCHVPVQIQAGGMTHYVGPALAVMGHHLMVVEVRGTTIRTSFHQVRRGAAAAPAASGERP